MSTKVLITGSSGQIGAAVARHLSERGLEVFGLCRRTSATLPPIVHQVSLDIASPTFPKIVLKAVPRCGAIVHAAACLDQSPYNPAVSMVNAVGIQHMLRLAADWKVSAFVFVSSASVIGTPKFVPITEDHRCEPLTVYHASKLFGEYATAIATRSGMAACSLRITSPAGPGTPGERFISILVQRAVAGLPLELHGRGTRRQNYVDVRDVAYAVSLCLENLPTGTFNIAGQSISNCDLASLVIKTLGSPSQIRFTSQRDPADLLDWTFSTQSAEATFGFRVQYQLEDSVTAIAKELREHAV